MLSLNPGGALRTFCPDAPRLSAKPPSEQPKTYTDGESYRGGHGIWNPNALHVRFRTSRPRTEKGRAGPL